MSPDDQATLDDLNHQLQDERDFVFETVGVRLPDWRQLPPPPPAPAETRRVSLDQTEIEIPLGPLFAPCSGAKLDTCIERFSGAVSEFHFVDPFAFRRGQRRPDEPRVQNLEFHPRLHSMRNFAVVPNPSVLAAPGPQGERLFRVTDDGMTHLGRSLDAISVFYLEEDGCGEGGSCIHWMSLSLLPLVLSRLMMGGLIVLGRRNNIEAGKLSRQAGGFRMRWDRLLINGEPGQEVMAVDRRLVCVGTLKRGGETDTVWQLKELVQEAGHGV